MSAEPKPQMHRRDGYTPGRFVLASTDARGARDPIGLTSQVKYMRERFQGVGHTPALILLVVADPELDAAVERVRVALEGER